MPGVFRTRSLVCENEKHTSKVTTGTPNTSAFPARWFYGLLRGLPGEPGFLATVPAVMRQHHRPVDTSVGVSGRRDFAVRDTRSRQSRASRPSHPALNVRDDRDTPLLIGRGTARLVDLICPTAQGKHLRHFGTTGKSLGERKSCQVKCNCPMISYPGRDAAPLVMRRRSGTRAMWTPDQQRNTIAHPRCV